MTEESNQNGGVLDETPPTEGNTADDGTPELAASTEDGGTGGADAGDLPRHVPAGAQYASLSEAVKSMVASGEGLSGAGIPKVGPLSVAVGFKVSGPERDAAYAELYPDAGKTSGTQPGSKDGKQSPPKGVPDTTLEACVQVAAVLTHRLGGKSPDGSLLLQKCGQRHVDAVEEAGADPDKLCVWACEEALRRSSSLNHKAIVAQSIV